MSTTGKVLTVLVLLVSLVALLFAAPVTQLNRNGAAAVKKLQDDIEKLEPQVAQAKTGLHEQVDKEHAERLKAERDRVVLQARQAETEKLRSQLEEIATRTKLQLETISATLKQAQADVQQRQAEKAAETKAKDDAEAEVGRLMAQNKESRERLDGLRARFRQALEANKQMVSKLRTQQGGASRPASYLR
jgi:hypothetical protein